jgi:hypothetical protein
MVINPLFGVPEAERNIDAVTIVIPESTEGIRIFSYNDFFGFSLFFHVLPHQAVYQCRPSELRPRPRYGIRLP